MMKINMMSKADMVKGQGVLSAYEEQTALAKKVLKDDFEVVINGRGFCDITHYHSINPEFYLTINRRKRQGITVGYVHFLPETVENSIRLPKVMKCIFYRYMISFYKKMDRLVTVNPCFIKCLQKYGIPKEKITYIPNVVSEDAFFPMDDKEKKRARKKYHIPQHSFLVLCVGQLQKRKGVFDFVETARQMPDATFVWAGGFSFGKISDGYDEIQAMIKHPLKNVRFLGLVEREEMNEIYNMADVMFLPSYEELFPMTILESMNCGIPVVVRDLPEYAPILADYVEKGKNQEEFLCLLMRLKSDQKFYQRSAEASFEGHKYYSREHVGWMWKEFYDDTGELAKKKRKDSLKRIRTERREKGVILWKQKEQQFS